MQRSEFIEIHGEKVWNDMVAPRQTTEWPILVRANANILVDNEIRLFLANQGLPANDLTTARKTWEATSQNQSWDDFLASTLCSREYYQQALARSWAIATSRP